jgi:hypothetical protein
MFQNINIFSMAQSAQETVVEAPLNSLQGLSQEIIKFGLGRFMKLSFI